MAIREAVPREGGQTKTTMPLHIALTECRAHGPDDIIDAYVLHAISHISASAARIKKNNDALKAGQDSEACRDQGFTRAKVRCPAPSAAPIRGGVFSMRSTLSLSLCLQVFRQTSCKPRACERETGALWRSWALTASAGRSRDCCTPMKAC